MIEFGEGRAAWEAYLADLYADPGEDAGRRLAQICLLVDGVLQHSSDVAQPDLPGGRPGRQPIRAAAAALLARAGELSDDVGAMWELLARMQATRYYRENTGSDGDGDVFSEQLALLEQASAVGARFGPEFAAWPMVRASQLLRDGLQDEASLEMAQRALALVLRAEQPTTGARHPVLSRATADPPFLVEHAQFLLVMEYFARSRSAMAARMLRLYALATSERDANLRLSARIRERPVLRMSAYASRASLARLVGDTSTALRLYQEQEREAAAGPESAQLRQLASAAANAAFLDQWTLSSSLYAERLRRRLVTQLGEEREVTPEVVLEAIEVMYERGMRVHLTAIGNDAFELARNLIDSGHVQLEPEQLPRARAWLDVATEAWREIALNGRIAVEFRRVELDAIEGVRDRSEVGQLMVSCSRRWRRQVGRRRAATKAARYGDPEDEAILERLLELAAEAPPVETAHLFGGVARWYLANGDAALARGSPERARDRWQLALGHAEKAVAGLVVHTARNRAVSLDPASEVDARQILGWALRRLRGVDPSAAHRQQLLERELVARQASLASIAQRFSASADATHRVVLDRMYRGWLRETAELAVAASDGALADFTAEVLRRDLVGTVLGAIAADPATPARIAGLFRELTMALGATADDVTSVEEGENGASQQRGNGGTANGGRGRTEEQVRGDRLAAGMQEALDVTGRVLGPVARGLFDPSTVRHYTVRSAAAAVLGEEPGAVLSLSVLAGSGPLLVLRHLCLRESTGAPLQTTLDLVSAPPWVAGLSTDQGQDVFFARLEHLTQVLFPESLLDTLRRAPGGAPVRLAVVPTGLLAVPFAALPLGDDLVLDHAVVSVAQSLQTLESLARSRSGTVGQPVSVAVFDTERFPHARRELAALLASHPGTEVATSLGELSGLLGGDWSGIRPGLLALAVHGDRGVDGWTQRKDLPNGERLDVGHVLQWCMPRLVAGASCNTDIRADAGGELGGFPLAFQLRGAIDIVGALHQIDDSATADIMSRFYAHTAAGLPTAAALRQAQLDWIAEDHETRASQQHLWSYLVTYGLPDA
ncbi:MAG: CHAT domain-containing protein [Kineosporiaceae bacterium]|nr:CHAT domain-containing protein [Kineosporiaceae bacterium]